MRIGSMTSSFINVKSIHDVIVHLRHVFPWCHRLPTSCLSMTSSFTYVKSIHDVIVYLRHVFLWRHRLTYNTSFYEVIVYLRHVYPWRHRLFTSRPSMTALFTYRPREFQSFTVTEYRAWVYSGWRFRGVCAKSLEFSDPWSDHFEFIFDFCNLVRETLEGENPTLKVRT